MRVIRVAPGSGGRVAGVLAFTAPDTGRLSARLVKAMSKARIEKQKVVQFRLNVGTVARVDPRDKRLIDKITEIAKLEQKLDRTEAARIREVREIMDLIRELQRRESGLESANQKKRSGKAQRINRACKLFRELEVLHPDWNKAKLVKAIAREMVNQRTGKPACDETVQRWLTAGGISRKKSTDRPSAD